MRNLTKPVARFELKMDAHDKELVAQAASLVGATMASFVRFAAKEKAQAMLENESRITLSKRDFAQFSIAINQAFTPNAALDAAMKKAKSVRRA
jgi:uncharacterized protein (DUF1778 family)